MKDTRQEERNKERGGKRLLFLRRSTCSLHLFGVFFFLLCLLIASANAATSTVSIFTCARTRNSNVVDSSSSRWASSKRPILSSSRRRTNNGKQQQNGTALSLERPTNNYRASIPVSTPRGGASNTNKKETETTNGTSAIQNFVSIVKKSKHHLIAAAAARAVSILGMYPLDTIKTRIQMGQSTLPSTNVLGGLFKGVQGSLLGQVPYGVLTFGSYEMYKQTLFEKFGGDDKNPPKVKPIFLYALSAILGDVTGSLWLCPSEVVKQQMQGGMYPTQIQALQSIYNKSGIKGFYQGYLGGLSRDVPFRVAQLTSYEITKNIYLQRKANKNNQQKEDVTLSPTDSAICGAIAGTFSAAITSPLDRIKTLLMTDAAAYGTNPFSCAKGILSNEGFSGLFQGITPRVIYIAPSVMIFFTVYEQVQQRLAN